MHQLLAIGDVVSIDFFQDFFGAGFGVLAVGRVIPGEGSQAVISRARIVLRFALKPSAQVVHEPRLASRITRGVDSFLTVLQQALRVGESPFLLRRACRRKEENFSFNRFR